MREKQIQHAIRRTLQGLGFAVDDMSQPRASMMPLGLPDLYVVHHTGLRFWIEVKGPRGKLSEHQAEWHERERAAGGTVFVTRSVDELIEQLQGLGVPVQ